MQAYEIFIRSVHYLCGTLNLQEALTNFFVFLQTQIPVTGILLGRVNRETLILERWAYVNAAGTDVTTLRTPCTLEQVKLIGAGLEEITDNEQGTLVDSLAHPLGRFIQKDVPPPFFHLRFRSTGVLLGGATFTFNQETPFTEEHVELLRGLRVPLLSTVHNCRQYQALEGLKEQVMGENISLRRELAQLTQLTHVNLIGARSGLAAVMERVRLAAPVDVPVLISGETGTGKELAARAIHELSPRREHPFVAVNCGGIPSSLIDSELFGHVKGAFTGALHDHKGRFERASRGSIFLDEIGELTLDMQARLLRVLQDKTIERVGGKESILVDFRFIAATNRDLVQMVAEGSFREDLYYRLCVVPVHLPPLRERRQDIPLLVMHFIKEASLRFGIKAPMIGEGEMEKLYVYPWPGNVRELQNVVEEALVLYPQGPLRFRHLPSWRAKNSEAQESLCQGLTFEELQKDYFSALLVTTHGRVNGPYGAAMRAGMHPNTLRGRLEKLGVPYKKGEV